MKHPIGKTHNGHTVYVDLIHSEAAKHIAEQPHLLGLVAEALRQTEMSDADVSMEYDMGRSIGYDYVVRTAETDTVFYAQLMREETYTRFVKNGKPLSTQCLTLILRLSEDEGAYDLQDAWVGRLNPPRPGASDETPESKDYWAKHAFVLASQSLQVRTITKVCPY